MNEDKLVEGILVPSAPTLQRYGWAYDKWVMVLHDQGYACGCCGKKPGSGRLYIDHEHARGWSKMPPEERALYVRGLACYVCNRFVLNYRVTALLMRQAADYLDAYHARRGV